MTDVLRVIEAALAAKGLSASAASKQAVGNPALIKNMQASRGETKRFNYTALEELAKVLDLELYFGPRRGTLGEGFTPQTLPHKGMAKCGINGWAKAQEVKDPIPAPSWIEDQLAFYVTPTGDSMIPEGIPPAALCLVTPSTKPKAGDRVWIRDKNGGATIKRLVETRSDRVLLRGWMPRENERQKSFEEERFLTFIEEMYPVAAVFQNLKPDDVSKAQLLPDPKAPKQTKPVDDGFEIVSAETTGHGFATTGVFSGLGFPSGWLRSKSLEARSCCLIHVMDDHMAPTIPQGATVLINKTETEPTDGQIFAIRAGSSIEVRRVYHVEGSRLLIAAANPMFTPTTHAASALNILGRVEWVSHTF